METYNFIEITEDKFDIYNINLKLFEISMRQKYSLGSDYFTIDHGKNYFRFFQRMGLVKYLIIQSDQTKLIVGTACTVLRSHGKNVYWYLCDLKIEESHRGKGLTQKLFLHLVKSFITISCRGYLVSMDPDSKQIFHILNGVKSAIPFKLYATKLFIYSVDVVTMKQIEKFFQYAFDKVAYLSLNGIKDLVLESTGQPMVLYHLQHSGNADWQNSIPLDKVPPNATIMFCLPNLSPLKTVLDACNIDTNVTATIMHAGMSFMDWHSLLTSQI
jgi:hypothetical protein